MIWAIDLSEKGIYFLSDIFICFFKMTQIEQGKNLLVPFFHKCNTRGSIPGICRMWASTAFRLVVEPIDKKFNVLNPVMKIFGTVLPIVYELPVSYAAEH